MYWSFYYWGMHLFWWIFWVALVVVLMSTGWPRSLGSSQDRAIETLRNRYAAGEIDETEYHERMAVLGGGNRPDRKTNAAV
jgi:putative membrane protein